MSSRWVTKAGYSSRVALAALFLLGVQWDVARAQSSANFRVTGAHSGATGGLGSSTNFRLVGESADARGRTSAASTDIIPGLIGSAFSSQANVSLPMGAAAYSAVAFPVTLANTAVTSVLASLGSPNTANWRFGRWSPLDSAYAEVGGTPALNNITRGHGYWLITKDAQNVSFTGLPARTDQYTILPLQSGPGSPARPAWNMMGNPYLYPIPVSLMFVDGGVLGIFNVNAVANVLTSQVVKVRSGSSYVDATVVNGRTAFWIKKLVPQAVTLYIPATPATTGSPEPSRQKPAGATWAVAINGLHDGRATETVWLGAAPVPARGWNPLAISRGPNPPDGEDFSLFVRRHDWAEMNDDYVRMFQPAAERMSWDLTLAGATGPGEAAFAIEGFDLPTGLRLYLTDPVAGWTREVAPGEGVRVAIGTAPKSLRFEATLASSPLATTPLVDGFRIAYPNPFRGQTGLSFSLARPGAVKVDIFDIQGRLVRSLGREDAGAGDHVLVWDGRDAGGEALGSGVYLTRWRAGSARGTGRLVRVE